MRELILSRINEILGEECQGWSSWNDVGRYEPLRKAIVTYNNIDPDTKAGKKKVATLTFEECFATCTQLTDVSLIEFYELMVRRMTIQR